MDTNEDLSTLALVRGHTLIYYATHFKGWGQGQRYRTRTYLSI